MFLRRLVPLVAALTVALAPVALDACQTTCAAYVAAATSDEAHAGHYGMHHGGSATEHSCHHPVAPVVSDAAATITGVPHSCGHTDTLPLSLASAQHMLAAPGVVPTPWVLSAPSSAAAPRIDTTAARDTIPIAAPLPLRV